MKNTNILQLRFIIQAYFFSDNFAKNFFNHSCKPNAFPVYINGQQKIRALTSISKGEEIFISYIDIGDSCLGRKAQLKKNYMFECKCERCKNEILTDTFKYGLLCSRCQNGFCTFANKQCSGCGVEMGFEQWKTMNRKVDKINEMLKDVSKLV